MKRSKHKSQRKIIPRSRQRHPHQNKMKKVRTPVHNEYLRQRTSRKDDSWTRHREQSNINYYGQSDVYNCLLGCGMINLREDDCSKGLYFALSIKLAICLRDFQQRLLENTCDVDYEMMCLKKFLDGHTLDRDDYHVEYIVPRGYGRETLNCRRPLAFLPLKHMVDMKDILNPFIDDIQFPQYNGESGIWIPIDPTITIRGLAKKIHKTSYEPLMFMGLNKIQIGTTVYSVKLTPDLKHFKTYWVNALQRIKTCIDQLDRVKVICKPTEEEIDYTMVEMKNILISTQIPVADLKMLATTLLGGLGPFTRNKTVLFRDTVMLSDLSHVQRMPRAKRVLKQYIDRLKTEMKKTDDDGEDGDIKIDEEASIKQMLDQIDEFYTGLD